MALVMQVQEDGFQDISELVLLTIELVFYYDWKLKVRQNYSKLIRMPIDLTNNHLI